MREIREIPVSFPTRGAFMATCFVGAFGLFGKFVATELQKRVMNDADI